MLGVWQSGGRHNWNNTEFDELYKKASAFTGDDNERTKMFQDAEKMLVEQAGAVFIYHATPGDLYRPYLKGTALEPDDQGIAAMHWPGFSTYSTLGRFDVHRQRSLKLSLGTTAIGCEVRATGGYICILLSSI